MNTQKLIKLIAVTTLLSCSSALVLADPIVNGVEQDTKQAVNAVENGTKKAINTTEQVSSDSWITTKVKSDLLADSVTKGFKIHVKTVKHVVTLSGTVDSQTTFDKAVTIVKGVKGVTNVKTTKLKIVTPTK